MNKKLKKLCSMALTLAITATSAMSMQVSAAWGEITSLSDGTVIDDKGLMKSPRYPNDEYTMLYLGHSLLRVFPFFGTLEFILSEDVDYEEANERVIEIFKEFYPEDSIVYPIGSTSSMSPSDRDKLINDDYKVLLVSETFQGVTKYIANVTYTDQRVTSINDESVVEAKKTSKALMKKLNEEKLISAFYDFGEVYGSDGTYVVNLVYSLDADIDLIYNYIDEHNLNCTIKKDDYFYTLEFNDDTDDLEKFLIAVDIYAETSIDLAEWDVLHSGYGELCGKNSLEDLTKTGDANEDEAIDIRDAAFIAKKIAQRKGEELPEWADYNNDETCDIRDAAAIARDVAKRIL